MANNYSDSVQKETANITEEQLARLEELFPEAFTESKIDFDKLRATLGDLVDDGPERYTFTWAGKRDAIRLLQTPTRATLIPCREESVNFDDTQHIFIEGDNLEVLKLLYKPYFGRVKMIYIDPPYNTGKDFIYPDNYADPLAVYLQLTGQQDAEGNLLTSNPETSGRYHSSWLSMMYPRLFLARQLLREDGVIFVSIDDHEVHNLRLLMNEVFGAENFVANVVWQKKYTRSNDAKWFSDNHDHILVYARSKEQLKFNLLPRTEKQRAAYSNSDNHPKGPWKATPLHAKSGRIQAFEYTFKNGVTWSPPRGTFPRYARKTLARLDANDEIWFGKDGKSTPARKTFLSNAKPGVTPVTIWLHEEVGHNHEANNELKKLWGGGIFDNPKPTRLIKRMLELATSVSDSDIVLDFFAGSCTTAHALLKLNHVGGGNRRFICVQLPEPVEPPKALNGGTILDTVADIGKERIRRVFARIRQEKDPQLLPDTHRAQEDLGFRVFKLAVSNYRPWGGVDADRPDAYANQMELFIDPLVEGWTAEKVIYEVALKEGYGLTCRIESLPIAVNTVYRVIDPDKEQSFHICLDDTISSETSRSLNLEKDNLFICRDVALDDDTAANLTLQCRLKTI